MIEHAEVTLVRHARLAQRSCVAVQPLLCTHPSGSGMPFSSRYLLLDMYLESPGSMSRLRKYTSNLFTLPVCFLDVSSFDYKP